MRLYQKLKKPQIAQYPEVVEGEEEAANVVNQENLKEKEKEEVQRKNVEEEDVVKNVRKSVYEYI